MRVLFSWIDLDNDLKSGSEGGPRVPKTGFMDGPTLQLLNLEKFDRVHLFIIARHKGSEIKARSIRDCISDYPREFQGKPEIDTHHINVLHPADYNGLFEEVPKKTRQVLEGYKAIDTKIFFNLSSGSPAMTSTWLFMVGSSEFDAELLSPQRNKKTNEVYLEDIEFGIYPHVNKLKDEIQKNLEVVQKFKSDKMREIYNDLTILAGGSNLKNRPILLLGETGTGKTTIAKQFHEMTGKPENSFKKVVCGEFNGADLNLVKSKLFGHAKGAYTGALDDYIGMLAEADGGTLFLDEIGDIPYDAQRLLIDALESKVFNPLNSSKVMESEFQLICATNKDLNEMVAINQIAKDFSARFTVFDFTIPPLRERPDDIPVIIEGLLEAPDYQGFELEDMALKKLLSYLKKSHLEKNIRDIRRILDHLFLDSQKPQPHSLTPKEVTKYFEENREPTRDDDFTDAVRQSLLHWDHTNHAERGKKWRDTFVDVALKILSERPEYKKRVGGLHIRNLSKMLGIDPKTINKRLESITF